MAPPTPPPPPAHQYTVPSAPTHQYTVPSAPTQHAPSSYTANSAYPQQPISQYPSYVLPHLSPHRPTSPDPSALFAYVWESRFCACARTMARARGRLPLWTFFKPSLRRRQLGTTVSIEGPTGQRSIEMMMGMPLWLKVDPLEPQTASLVVTPRGWRGAGGGCPQCALRATLTCCGHVRWLQGSLLRTERQQSLPAAPPAVPQRVSVKGCRDASLAVDVAMNSRTRSSTPPVSPAAHHYFRTAAHAAVSAGSHLTAGPAFSRTRALCRSYRAPGGS
jgi:hypothetical protein